MYLKKAYGYVLPYPAEVKIQKGRLDSYDPPTVESENYKNWIAVLDLKTCPKCRSNHGQIYCIGELPEEMPPLHPNCRCKIKPMKAIVAGFATKNGVDGADWWLKHLRKLPDYYIPRTSFRNWDGNLAINLLNLCLAKCLQQESMRTTMSICHRSRDEFGTKRISTILPA